MRSDEALRREQPVPTIELAGRPVGSDHPPLVIAEIGINHGGSIDVARELIDSAAKTGADAVKFQWFRAEELVTASAKLLVK